METHYDNPTNAAGTVYRGCLLFGVKTKYISSSQLKISAISRVHNTSEIADIFSTYDDILLLLTEKKILFILSV